MLPLRIASAQKPRETSGADAATPSPLQSSAWGKSGQPVPRWHHLDNFHKRYNKVLHAKSRSPADINVPSVQTHRDCLGGASVILWDVIVCLGVCEDARGRESPSDCNESVACPRSNATFVLRGARLTHVAMTKTGEICLPLEVA